MGDASLSQEEIDALLMGADEVDTPPAMEEGFDTPSMQDHGEAQTGQTGYDNLVQQLNVSMQNASNSASSLVNKNLVITNAMISEIAGEQLVSELSPGSILVDMDMGSSRTALVFDESVATRIAMSMMGEDNEPPEMDDAHLSTIGELANTLLSSLSKNLGQVVGSDLTPSSPTTVVYRSEQDIPQFRTDQLAKISYDLNIDSIGTSKMVHYIEIPEVLNWAEKLNNATFNQTAQNGADTAGSNNQPQAQQQQFGGFQMSAGGFSQGMDSGGGPVNINPVNFPSMSAGGMGQGQIPSNIDLLLDVQMVLTVELGRTKKYVKDILSLGEGSIIELDKLAGEPVDLLVNGKLIAKGEVVVIDENFGVRVTDIVGPAERLARMAAE